MAWRDAGLERLTPHACRHTFASLMIAAGVNAKALSTFMGHAKIGITLDRYGHLMPGAGAQAARETCERYDSASAGNTCSPLLNTKTGSYCSANWRTASGFAAGIV